MKEGEIKQLNKSLFILLSLGILNNAFNWSDFIELNGMMISEL
jgi:hypothetical protein